jgi:hypothetical protein
MLADVLANTRRWTPAGCDSMFDAQPTAPGLSEQVHRLESQRGPHFVDLANEALQGPESYIIGALGFAAAELIVEHDPSRVGQLIQRLQVIMAGTRTAVQQQ